MVGHQYYCMSFFTYCSIQIITCQSEMAGQGMHVQSQANIFVFIITVPVNVISSGSQLPQSGIGIPASGFSPVPLVMD
jgi:hypothetical protein